MNLLSNQFWFWVGGLTSAAFLFVTGLFVWPKLRRGAYLARWWLVGLAVLTLTAMFLFVLPRRYPTSTLPISALPGVFRRGYWSWVLLFLLTGLFASVAAAIQLIQRRRRPTSDDEAGETARPEEIAAIDAAWDEITLRFDQAGVDLSRQRVYLMLAPAEGWFEALIESSGLQVFARAPETAAPIQACAVPGGVLLSVVGASAFGTNEDGGGALLAALARRLLAQNPDCPIVRGVVVLMPIVWAARSESVRQAAFVREDLRALGRVLKVRLPVFALFTGMEATPGFVEFIDRLSTQYGARMLEQRVGFAVPAGREFNGELMYEGLTWMAEWFEGWNLTLLAGDVLNHASNAELETLGLETRRFRKRLRSVLESAFTTPREADPVLFRGCYFVAAGADRSEQAFTAGLLRGDRSRVLADHTATRWTHQARLEDRRYARIAVAVGTIGGGLSLLTWLAVARITPLGWLGLAALVVAWALVLWRWLPERPQSD